MADAVRGPVARGIREPVSPSQQIVLPSNAFPIAVDGLPRTGGPTDGLTAGSPAVTQPTSIAHPHRGPVHPRMRSDVSAGSVPVFCAVCYKIHPGGVDPGGFGTSVLRGLVQYGIPIGLSSTAAPNLCPGRRPREVSNDQSMPSTSNVSVTPFEPQGGRQDELLRIAPRTQGAGLNPIVTVWLVVHSFAMFYIMVFFILGSKPLQT